MSSSFSDLAAAYDLDNVTDRSPDGLEERYLYSQDMTYRYAFRPLVGQPGPGADGRLGAAQPGDRRY